MTDIKPLSILMVCLGNICRSPTAQSVLMHKVEQQGLNWMIDSAGILDYHQGKQPDTRSMSVARAKGYQFQGFESRPVVLNDFSQFDLILAMDKQNLKDLSQQCPTQHQDKVKLLLSYLVDRRASEVPDPYYDDESGFANVLGLIEDACDDLIVALTK